MNYLKIFFEKFTSPRKTFLSNYFFFLIIFVTLTLEICSFFIPTNFVFAAPAIIPLKIRLRDGSGVPFTSPTVIGFTVYGLAARTITTSTLDAAPLIWQESYTGGSPNCPLIHPDAQGFFFISLGSCAPFPNSIRPSSAFLAIKIWPKPGSATVYETSFDTEGSPSSMSAAWVHNRFVPFQALRGSAQLNLKTKELLPYIDEPATFSTEISSTGSSSTPSVSADDLTLALQFLESRLSAVTSTFVQASASSTIALLQNAVFPTLSVANLTVTESPTFNGNLVVQGTVGFGVDTIGQAKILAGFTTVTIPFAKPYDRAPLVVATPLNYDGLWKLPFVTTTGFALRLSVTSTDDVLFSWYAFMPSAEAHIVVSQPEDQSVTIKVIAQPQELVHTAPVVADEPQVVSSTSIVVVSSTQPTEVTTTTADSLSSTNDAITNDVTPTSTSTPIPTPTSTPTPLIQSPTSSVEEQPVVEIPASTTPDVPVVPPTTQSSSI
jgi:hypothetical protein